MKTFKRILVIGGNALLLLILSANLWQMYRSYLTAQDLLNQEILAGNPDALIRNINQAGGSPWLWIVNIIAVLVCLFLLVSWLTPLHYKKWFWTFNWVWLLVWVAYLGVGLTMIVVYLNRLA